MPETTNGIPLTDLATLVTAVSTVIYTAGTFMLWKATNKSIILTQLEVRRKEEILNTTYISNVYKNFREIYSSILNDPENAELLANEQSLTVPASKKEYMGSFLINHAFEIYSYHQNRLLPDEFWKRVVIDMKVLFGWKFIEHRWQKIRTLYPTEFANFIDNEIIEPKIF